MKFSFFMLVIVLVNCPYLVAQNCTNVLSGTIIDFHDRTPLVGATVQVAGNANVVLSDFEGNFSLGSLCDGIYELEISHPECSTKFVKIDVQGDTSEKITLEHHLEELDEVKVVGDAVSDATNTAQEKTLRIDDLERYSAGSLGDALKQISGVNSLNTGANIVKPVIQGLNGSRVLILNNGVRMHDMEWGDEHAPNVDINAVDHVSVIKGAAALKYGGDAIGGLILMEPARIPAKDSLYGKTLLTGATNGRGGNITTELTKAYKSGWFAKGQASFKRYGDFEAPDYVLSNTGASELGVSIGLGKHDFVWGWDANYSYFDTDIAILRASDIGNTDDLIRAINGREPLIVRDFEYAINKPRQEVTHHLAKLGFYRRFEGLGKWNLQYDFQHNQRFEFDIRVGDDREKASIDLRLATHSLSTDFKIDAKRDFILNFGLMGLYQNNFANPDTGVRRLIPDYDKYDVGAFATLEYTVSNTLLLDAGMRYDFNYIEAKKFYRTSRWEERGYDVEFPDLVIEDLGTQLLTNPKFEYHNLSATVGMQYQVSNDTELRFNYALAQRAPNPSELFSDGLHHSAARIELGDLRIESETSKKLSLSIQKEGNTWGYNISPYANFITNFIVLEPTGVEFNIRGAFPVWTYRQTTARLLGLDTNLYSQWTDHWRTDHKFSIVNGKDTDLERPLINIPAVNLNNSISYANPVWKDFKITLESQYIFRQNEFPPNIMVFSPEQGQEVLLDINTPPEAYHLVALDTSFKIPLNKRNTLSVGLTVNNLLNQSYRDYLNRLRYYADDLGRNFLIRLKLNY